MLDLTLFYNADHYRGEIAAPCSDAEYTYATNGHLCVRVPRRADIAESRFSERAARLFAEHTTGHRRQWFGIPELPAKKTHACPDCVHGCSGCDNGWIETLQSVDVGNSYFQRKYLSLINSLPNVKISPRRLQPAWFIFDGGDGLLMPMKRRTP